MKYIPAISLFVIAIVNAQSNDNITADEEKRRVILSIFGPPSDQPNPIEQPTTSETLRIIDEATTTTTNALAVGHCGIRNVGGLDSGMATASNDGAGFGEFPWTVAILQNIGVAVSAGSLIHPKIVLTVYHHVKKFESTPELLKVRAGEWDARSTAEPLPYQEQPVFRIIGHPDYNNRTHPNNVALVELVQGFTLDSHINTICLPPAGLLLHQNDCFATGWGKNAFGSSQRNRIVLKKVPLGVVESSKCERQLRATQLGTQFQLHPTFVCAGGNPGVDTCQGDGGGPLMCPIGRPEDNQYWQIGIVAWGIGCGRPIPGIYTNVAIVRQWIDEVVQFIGFDSKTYTLDVTQLIDIRT